MDSRRRAARPRRAGETYARTHHLDTDDDPTGASDAKRVKFDVRNPSALAFAEKEEDDAFLDADVIGRRSAGTTKRGAVNIEGFDSDSDADEFDAKAQRRGKKEEIDLNEKFAKYDPAGDVAGAAGGDDDDDDMNMFAGDDDGEEGGDQKADDDSEFYSSGRKKKDVQFLDSSKIEGQVHGSKSGGQIRLDHEPSDSEDDDDDEEEEGEGEGAEEGAEGADEAWKGEVLDEELGAGGRKKRAPKVEAFNLREELEQGRFDENQNYVRNAVDPDAVHDKWLDGVSKRQIRRAAEAHERREAEAEELRREEDEILTADLLSTLIRNLERGETALEALARLGRRQNKDRKVPKWKLKKTGAMEEDDPEQERISSAIADVTDAADKLFSRDHAEIYDREREMLVREYKKETGEEWVEPPAEGADGAAAPAAAGMWEFRWTDGRDSAAKQGPFDGPTMKAWQDAGYFGEGVEFRPAGEEGAWSRVASFV